MDIKWTAGLKKSILHLRHCEKNKIKSYLVEDDGQTTELKLFEMLEATSMNSPTRKPLDEALSVIN